MSDSAMKNCPFCGGEAGTWGLAGKWKAGCLNATERACPAEPETAGWSDSEEDAVYWWNRRAPVLDEGLVERLREAVHVLRSPARAHFFYPSLENYGKLQLADDIATAIGDPTLTALEEHKP